MSLGEVSQISEGIYAYLQPDGSWYLNNTGFLVSPTGVISSKIFLMPNGSWVTFTGPTSSWAGAGRGDPIDLATAVLDMVAYNGGQPLTCHA